MDGIRKEQTDTFCQYPASEGISARTGVLLCGIFAPSVCYTDWRHPSDRGIGKKNKGDAALMCMRTRVTRLRENKGRTQGRIKANIYKPFRECLFACVLSALNRAWV